MKKQLMAFVVLSLALAAGTALAADGKKTRKAAPAPVAVSSSHGMQNMAGCGLGSMAIQDNSKWAQVGAAFLNGTGMQTFGISFGTSNCTEDGMASASREKDAFVEANLADLRRDLSVGSGDYLSSLASLYGCKGERAVEFNRALRKHQGSLLNGNATEAPRAFDSAVNAEHVSCQG
jgi:Protein of unknown function (DUF3015)